MLTQKNETVFNSKEKLDLIMDFFLPLCCDLAIPSSYLKQNRRHCLFTGFEPVSCTELFSVRHCKDQYFSMCILAFLLQIILLKNEVPKVVTVMTERNEGGSSLAQCHSHCS